MRMIPFPLALSLAFAAPALAAPCGGDFGDFLTAISAEAVASGLSPEATASFMAGATRDGKVLKADRAQGIFRKPFLAFSQSLISAERLALAKEKSREYDAILSRAEAEYGVSRGILLAFWAFETNFGSFQGDFNTRNALLTLSHDCRRPELFQPQVLAAIRLHQLNEFPLETTGAWAGEIGMVQMLPADILTKGVDGDGDGLILLKTSAEDALLSAANMLVSHGWQAHQPWISEVAMPEDFDWALSGLETVKPVEAWTGLGVLPRQGELPRGLPASILLPQGHRGPAFMVYENFATLFDWNQSFTYVATAAYFASRIEGAPAYTQGNPEPQLSLEEMKALQEKLAARGHEVGKIDGILGAGTRAAVQSEQKRLGLPADAWPTLALLQAL